MWCWKQIEDISWTNRARNEEALQRVKGEWDIAVYNTEMEG